MILSILLVLLRLGSYSYIIITNAILDLTVNQLAAASFAVSLGGSLYFFSFATSFYASILSSKFFRKVFYERILFFYRRCVRQLS